MSDVRLFIGGTPNPLFPNADGRNEYREPHASRVAYEYANGEFTLGWPLKPSELIYQRRALESADLAVGDHILMYAVPAEHLLTSVLARVDDIDDRFAGATLKPTAMLWDSVKKAYEESDILDSLFDNISLTERTITFAKIKGSVTDIPEQTITEGSAKATIPAISVKSDGGYFVPPGKTLVLGFKVTAMPTDTTRNFGTMLATVSLVAKVSGFDIPTAV